MGKEKKEGYREGDEIYDHPTPLDGEGTLKRTIQSINILENKNFDLVIIACPVRDEISEKVEKKVREILRSSSTQVRTFLFAPSTLGKIHKLFSDKNREKYIPLLSIYGYSNVRNLCIFIPHILNSDVAILIDDDEVFEDKEFINKAIEFIGKEIGEEKIFGIAGYYVGEDGDYHIKKEIRPWMKEWGQYDKMNEAFDRIIGRKPRLKKTPFVFGGNMIIHKELFRKIPFDPNVPRGEDIDYLINAKMFGFDFFLDNELKITHLPPPKFHPIWRQLRQDIKRFIYEREKIRNQKEREGMRKICPEDFDPYPGFFLKDNLEDRIEKACRLLAKEYSEKGDKIGERESLRNIEIAKNLLNSKIDAFEEICKLQKIWQELMEYTYEEKNRREIENIIKEGEI